MGILPAIDVGKSVSRVGGKAQLPAYSSITGNLKLAYSQFEELENYARFGTRLDEGTRKIIEHGKRIRIWLKQQELQPIPVPRQIAVLLALTSGLFDTISTDTMQEAEAALLKSTEEIPVDVIRRLFTDKELSALDREAILTLARNTLDSFQDKSLLDKDTKNKTDTPITEKEKPDVAPGKDKN